MSLLKKTNAVRRKLMGGLTKNIGSSSTKNLKGPIDRSLVKRVLICRPNHRLGNQLLLTPLVQEISETFPNCKIDLFTKGNLAPILFQNYETVDRIISLPKKHFKQLPLYLLAWTKIKKRKYDLVINVDKNSSSGRISTKLARGTFKFFGNEEEEVSEKPTDHEHLAKYSIYNLRKYLSKSEITPAGEIPSLNLKLDEQEIAQGKKIVQDLVKNEKRTLSIFTYATGNKCYSKDWWSEFYKKLKKEFNAYNIIEILPVENISQIDFQAPAFYSKDIREITSVIANTEVFIGADSGMMHLASASQTPTFGLFSVTRMNKYEPYGNKSLGINTNETGMEEIIELVKTILSTDTP
ncbi:MAG TPA: glycosyltransferase family 9 protein [Flavobacteriaceae bacterium]|nr:glycosyltransferase family 9 protein [Flavobacteriaceae bacterium]